MKERIKKRLSDFIVNVIFNLSDETKATLFSTLFNASIKFSYENYRKKYTIDKDFRFNGIHIFLYGDGNITLGKNSYIGDYSTIQCEKDARVVVGEKCSISHNVRIYTSSNVANQDFSLQELNAKIGDVFIDDYVWIGANVFINPGVHIGRNSVVGANSVVVNDIPPNSIYGGVPAKLIKVKSISTIG